MYDILLYVLVELGYLLKCCVKKNSVVLKMVLEEKAKAQNEINDLDRNFYRTNLNVHLHGFVLLH